MAIEDIRRAMQSKPFVPFHLKMVDGSVYAVTNTDFIAVPPTPKGRTITVYVDGTELTWVDRTLIESIEFLDTASTNDAN